MMKKLAALFLFGVFFSEVAMDAMEGQCQASCVVSCRACVCQIYVTNPDFVGSAKVLGAEPGYIVLKDPRFSQRLYDKSFFHPPESIF